MHLSGAGILLLFLIISTAAILFTLHLTRLGRLVHATIPDRPRRRMFLASIGFFITFLAVRLLVWSIEHHVGPFGYVTMRGRHIHHLVWGILILIAVGYLSLTEVGERETPSSIFASRLISLLYGIGAALTLDEFALWLNLADVYWKPEGRASIDAIVLFGALLGIGAWGAPLFSALAGKRKSAQRIIQNL